MATDSSPRARPRGFWLSVASAFSSLAYLAVLSSYARDIIGSTADATTAVAAAVLVGTAVGALSNRVSYRASEIGIALYCLSVPLLLPWLGDLYLIIAPSIVDASALARNTARFAFAMFVFAVPGFALGVTIRTLGTVSTMIAGAALGLVCTTHVLIPRFGLVASLAIATLIKLALPLMSLPPTDTEPRADGELTPLPWKMLIVAAATTGVILSLVFFRAILAFALQYPAALPVAAGAVLVTAVLTRRGLTLPPSTPRWLAAVTSGSLIYLLVSASPHGARLLLAVAVGALVAHIARTPHRWILPSLVLAGAGFAFGAVVLAAMALGTTFSVTARSLRRPGRAYSAAVVGAVGALVLSSILESAAPTAEREIRRGTGARLVTLFTPERVRALVAGRAAFDTVRALDFDDIVCASSHGSSCLREDPRSVLFESPKRHDVIVLDDAPTRELSQLASRRLRRHGVVIYPLPIGRLSSNDVFRIINTTRSTLAHVSVWRRNDGTFVVASNEPLLVDLESVRSDWDRALRLMRGLVVADDDMDRFLDAMAALVDESREDVVTDNRPIAISRDRQELTELQNQAIFEHLESEHGLPFRGTPTSEETKLARAAFGRGSLPRLAEAWVRGSSASLAASTWLYQELGGHDASELRESLGELAKLVSVTNTATSCEPIPRFVSRLDRVELEVRAHSGESLDDTQPGDAVDGTFDPFIGKGWRVRPGEGAVALEVALASPAHIDAVHLVVMPLDDTPLRARLFGRDASGTWYPLASDPASECPGARRFRLSSSAPELDALRVEVDGGAVVLHELWAEAS